MSRFTRFLKGLRMDPRILSNGTRVRGGKPDGTIWYGDIVDYRDADGDQVAEAYLVRMDASGLDEWVELDVMEVAPPE